MVDLPRLLRSISDDSVLSDGSMSKEPETPQKLKQMAQHAPEQILGSGLPEKDMSPALDSQTQEMMTVIAISAVTVHTAVTSLMMVMMTLMTIMPIIMMMIVTANEAKIEPELPERRSAHAFQDGIAAGPSGPGSQLCPRRRRRHGEARILGCFYWMWAAVLAFILILFGVWTEGFLAFILILVAYSALQNLMALGGLRGVLKIAARGSCKMLAAMLRENAMKVENLCVLQQSARTTYCNPLSNTFQALGSQYCNAPLLHNVPLGNVRAEPGHEAAPTTVWHIPFEDLQ